MTVAMLASPSFAPGSGRRGGKVLSMILRTSPIETRRARLVTRRVPIINTHLLGDGVHSARFSFPGDPYHYPVGKADYLFPGRVDPAGAHAYLVTAGAREHPGPAFFHLYRARTEHAAYGISLSWL